MSTESLSEADTKDVKAAIESFTRALEAKDFDSWVAYWDQDCVLMPPGHSRLVGRQAILEYVRTNFGNVQSVTLSDWQILGEGGLAIATTNVQWTNAGDSAPSPPVKQVLVLSRDGVGKWPLKIVIYNAGV